MKFAIVMFLHKSVCPQGGVSPIACWDTHTPGQTPPGQTPPWADTPEADTPWADNPPWADTPEADTPWADTLPPRETHPAWENALLGRHSSPWADTPSPWADPPAQCMLGYGQQAGGTHPTGMQSC